MRNNVILSSFMLSAPSPSSFFAAHQLFASGGIIYNAASDSDAGFGAKADLNRAEAGYSLPSGIAFRL